MALRKLSLGIPERVLEDLFSASSHLCSVAVSKVDIYAVFEQLIDGLAGGNR
jgi:hypothetical protein